MEMGRHIEHKIVTILYMEFFLTCLNIIAGSQNLNL